MFLNVGLYFLMTLSRFWSSATGSVIYTSCCKTLWILLKMRLFVHANLNTLQKYKISQSIFGLITCANILVLSHFKFTHLQVTFQQHIRVCFGK